MWYAAAGLLVVAAIVLYLIDADPAFLFQSPIASLIIAGAGVGVAYWGHQRARASSRND